MTHGIKITNAMNGANSTMGLYNVDLDNVDPALFVAMFLILTMIMVATFMIIDCTKINRKK